MTLLEMMVAVTLLAVIMVGLLAMFQYTQRALHVAHMQTDVFENVRAAVQLVTRDISEMTDYGDSNAIGGNFSVTHYDSPVGNLQPPAMPPPGLSVSFDEVFWLTRVNDEWQGLGYYVAGAKNSGVGTLYRFSETTDRGAARDIYNTFTTSTNFHRVSDGVVHFRMDVVYPVMDANGRVSFSRTKLLDGETRQFPSAAFGSNTLPAYVDFEIGVLEPATLKQFNALTNNPDATISRNFLQNQVGRVHFFRERVPIHNFINPHRVNEPL